MAGKVAIIGPAFPLRGGIANFNEALAATLAKQGYEVTIFSFKLQYPSLLFPGKSQKDDSGTPPPNVDIQHTINSIGPLSWFKTARQIAEWRPQLVIVRFWMPFFGPSLGTILRQLKKRHNCPVVAITDNVVPHEKRPGDRQLTQYFLRPVDAFISMSKSVLADLNGFQTRGPKAFLPHPIYDIFGEAVSREAALAELKLDPTKRYILFFGIVRQYKGLDILLSAMQHVQRNDVQLIVAGEFYDDKAEYERQIEALGINEKVLLHDRYIPMDQVTHYFNACDIVAQTYRTATQSGVTQIAYHFEIPMLVTDVGGLAEIVPDGKAGYVCPIDPPTIGAALTSFFEKDKFAEMKAGVQAEKEKYSWEKFVFELKELVKQID